MKLLVTLSAVIILTALWALGGMRGDSKEKQSMLRQSDDVHNDNGPAYSKSGHDLTRLSDNRVEQLAAELSGQERHIILEKGTERPGTGELLSNKEKGLYACRLCGLPLFDSGAKFDSGTGWPSFFEPLDSQHVALVSDKSLGMVRTEVLCTRCRGHLGHVFDDGPRPSGQRYCMNSAALRFHSSDEELPSNSRPVATETAYFAGGCFWGIEDRFQQVPGVIDAVSGYMGGSTPDPQYKQVCSGSTGHAETVRVTFDRGRVSFERLLEWFFKFHDGTQLNRQGVDVGTQYRSAIFASNDGQLAEAKGYIEKLQRTDEYRGRQIVTHVEPAGTFFAAEEYHQDYHAKHGGSCSLPAR